MEDFTSSGNDIHWDTHFLKMNGSTYYFNPAAFNGTLYTDQACSVPSSSFVTTRPSGMQPLKDEGEEFEASDPSDNVITIYYLTDVSVTTNEKTWSFYLQDDEGLVTPTHKITNIARELTAPAFRITSGSTCIVGEYGYYNLEVTHDLKCLDSSALLDNVTIYLYIIDETDAIVDTYTRTVYSGSNSVTFNLDRGTYYRIKAVAKKEGFTSSDPVYLNNITVNRPMNFYVSSEGYDYYAGTATQPYRTIQRAVYNFLHDYSDEAACNIYVLSNLTPDDGDFSDTYGSSSSLITIPSEAAGKTINIIGSGAKRTINAQRTSTTNGNVVTIEDGTTTNHTVVTFNKRLPHVP